MNSSLLLREEWLAVASMVSDKTALNGSSVPQLWNEVADGFIVLNTIADVRRRNIRARSIDQVT